jgi:hypothetical protein
MKKVLFLALALAFLCSTSFAQKNEEKAKNSKEKELKGDIKEKALKAARKEAKKLTAEGWKVSPGSLPLDKLIEKSWMKQYMEDDKGNASYITADGNAVAESKSAAEMQAIELGKLQLAGLIETNMNSLISANVANAQLSTKDAASVTEVVQSAKNLIAMQLGYVNPEFKLYRDLKDGKIEIQVRLFYDVKQSLEIAKKVVRKELKEKLQMNEKQLDEIIGMPKVDTPQK